MRSSVRPLPWPALVFAAAAAAFSPVLENGFVNWDDPVNLLTNPHYRGLGWENLKWMFGQLHFGMYQPLAWLTFAADHALWGMRPGGYHLTSLLFHCANGALFLLVVRELLAAAGARPSRELDLSAAAAALLFALHPLRTESVAWATERRDVVSGLFYLWAVLLYLRRAREGPPGFPRGAWGVYLLALLSKGIVITLPALLLVIDLYPLRRLPPDPRSWKGPAARRVLLEKLAFLGAALPAAALGWAGQAEAGEIGLYAGQGVLQRLLQAAYGLGFYLWKTAVPLGLSPLYARPAEVSLADPRFAGSLAFALALTALLWRLRRRFPAGLAAWAAYAVTLSPVSGLVSYGPQLVADRYSYLSCLAPAALAGAGLHALLRRPERRAPALACAALALALLGGLSWSQSRVWRDDEALWSHAVRADPGNPVVRSFLGNVRARQGRTEDAAGHFREALRLRPDYAAAHNNLANMLVRLGRLEEALPHYREAARLRPDHPAVNHNWGAALLRLGRPREAASRFRAELAVNPGDRESRLLLERLEAEKKAPASRRGPRS